ncbi:thiamine phosphate synthase [Paenibacillus azoreducens]|uniref:Thiamine-phosphate synthase n=1 Tax=Paenibacillus azoreducens TaxID=116718 RepID=A0A920CUD1_9BACL|nr:thiamine phosphate synthase [Paenibacillus azoreducens]GIO49302.1 thiamine-phosphate synthase [Paenibacillus azoreducens]
MINQRQMKEYLRLYLVLGSVNCKTDPASVVEEAIRGGVTMVQFREKGRHALKGEAKKELAIRIHSVCRRFKVPLIINDDVDLLLEIDAEGIHIGQEDEPAHEVRARIGDKILGLSVHTPREAELTAAQQVDYLGVGPIYPTTSKEDARQPRGPEMLREIRSIGTPLPMVGIGGISAERAADVIRAGADGLAVISAITGAEDICQATRKLAEAIPVIDRHNS